MNLTANPGFNPALGLAFRGMWGLTFARPVIDVIDENEDPEPTSEPEAA